MWWSEVCGVEEKAGGFLKVEQGSIQEMVKARKAPEWNNGSAWEWIERRVHEAIGTWAKWSPSTGGKRWTQKVKDRITEWSAKLGLDKGLSANLDFTLHENCHSPTFTSKKYLEHLLVEVRKKRKTVEKDIRKGQNKEWKDKVEKWVDSNSKEAYKSMKLGEKGNTHHTVITGRIPNISEEADEAEQVWEGWCNKEGVGDVHDCLKDFRSPGAGDIFTEE